MNTAHPVLTVPAAAGVGLAPTQVGDRIVLLDVLRGWAILGILAVNAMAFAWPFALETNSVTLPWMAAPANEWADWVVQVFFEHKFRTLFSMLFGVSIFLVGGERSDEARGRLLRRRLFWLAVFGLIHGLALWFGDILLLYAWSGVLMLFFRSWPPGRLLWVGGLIVGLGCLMEAGLGYATVNAGGEFARQMEASRPEVTPEAIQGIIDQYRSGLVGALSANFANWLMLQFASLVFIVWGTLGLMMVGLGLFKTGFLTGRAPTWVYLLVLGIGAGNLAAFGWLEWREMVAGPDANVTGGLDRVAGSFAILITLAYASGLILLTRLGVGAVTGVLAPVGRMAFTNYLTQTLIMTTLFYMPWGPRLFGSVEPAPLWGIVGAVWVAQLIWSPLWLSRFQMGPLEWVWRCLTYGRWVPIRA
ncbi:DUF418 domain-containing protein [Brevundimonas sp. LM2]|uniref:DUF418 domain-containing protein n=1 Tax=Brevundimonas sp. LM2 TaxID=1938605 RepID=UPI00098417E2|nr:DUF418 domain-containing protein [Brevundimonas sp. LM2]